MLREFTKKGWHYMTTYLVSWLMILAFLLFCVILYLMLIPRRTTRPTRRRRGTRELHSLLFGTDKDEELD